MYYSDVVEYACQTDGGQAQLDWYINDDTADSNNYSITTQFTSNSTRSVLKMSAVPTSGDETITIIMCILRSPSTNENFKTASLTIRGTVNH